MRRFLIKLLRLFFQINLENGSMIETTKGLKLLERTNEWVNERGEVEIKGRDKNEKTVF